jgi:hypothetical protein
VKHMGTLFIRLKEKGKKLKDLKKYLLEDITIRSPSGLIKKDRSPNAVTKGNEGIKHVKVGDLVVIIHEKGYHGRSGIVAIGNSTTACLSVDHDTTNPPMSSLEPYAVALNSIEWHCDKVSTTKQLVPAIAEIDLQCKLSGPGWRYSHHDLRGCISKLLGN